MVVLLQRLRSRIDAWWMVHIALFVLTTLMWSPALFHGKSIIHGDSLDFSLPVLAFLRDFLHGGPSPMWLGQTYGGHPLFAEGQGAFLEPLNLLIAWLMPPVLGSNVFHYVCMLAAGAGVIRLCKELGISAWAAGFAGLAVVFSTAWIVQQNNMTISGALLWAPWILVAFERWLKEPTVPRALCMSSAGCLLVFAGYPQVLHGVAIFVAGSLAVIPLTQSGRQLWQRHRTAWLCTGALAAAFCVGLSAIQWLPTLELTEWSRRSAGIPLLIADKGPPFSYLRGMFFPLGGPMQIPGVGSLFVCLLACLFPWFSASPRKRGYVVATLLMLVLSLGPASRLFRLAYSEHLIPGLHFFRSMGIYSAFCALGVAVLAACSIDALRQWLHEHPGFRGWGWWIGVLILMSVGIALALVAHPTRGLWQTIAITWVAFFAVVALAMWRRAAWLPATLFVLMLVQVAGLSLHSIHFHEAPRFPTPSILDQLPDQDPRDRKIFPASIAIIYAFLDSRTPHLEQAAQRAMASDAGMSNLFRGTWSYDGALALHLQNHALLDQPMADEVHGHGQARLGARLIDVLAIHYVVADSALDAAGLRVFGHDPVNNFWVMENTFARPFLQVYRDATVVASSNEALARLRVAQDPTLILQQGPHSDTLPPADTGPGDVSQVHTRFVTRQVDQYAIDVQAPFACWLFLADANYPGWHAQVDGQPATVWTAQLLGKAVHVPAGTHRVVLSFQSGSFRIGRLVSILSLLAMMVILGLCWRTRSRQEQRVV
jgi:hypothetical protein